MKLWKIALFAVIAIASSCSIQQKPKLHVTHVIAVTHEGDTLKLPIDVIRPINNYRIINYSGYGGWGYNYGWNSPYYYNYHKQYDYSQGSTGRSSNNSSNSKNSNNNNKSVPARSYNKPTPPPGVDNIKIPD